MVSPANYPSYLIHPPIQSSRKWKHLSNSNFFLFTESIELALRRWTALNLAKEHLFAGSQTMTRIEELHDELYVFFDEFGTDVTPDTIEGNLVEYFDKVFNTGLEDGSGRGIGELLCRLYKDIVIENRLEGLETLREKARKDPPSVKKPTQTVNLDSEEDDSDDEEEDDGDDNGEEEEDDDDEMDDFEREFTGQPHNGNKSNSNNNSMDVDPTPISTSTLTKPTPIIDEDGFELVQKKGKRRS